jgi:hypothetical protein
VGCLYFNNFANLLDQVLINQAMARPGSPMRVADHNVKIVRFPDLVGTYPVPIRFGGMGKPVNTDGFSDHYPIAVRVNEDD